MPTDTAPAALTAIPNVGPAIARKLFRLDVHGSTTSAAVTRRSCSSASARSTAAATTRASSTRSFAAVAYADGGPARSWWEFSRERKARARS